MEMYQMPQQVRDSLEHMRQPLAVYQFGEDKLITLALSDGYCALFGYRDRAEAVRETDRGSLDDTHPDDVSRVKDAISRFIKGGERYEVIYRSRIKDSSGYRVIHAFAEHIYTETGEHLAHVWFADEGPYTEDSGLPGEELNRSLNNALRENSILKASRFDELTGLPNMTYFFELAETGGKNVREAGGSPVMLYMDFSGMKFFNTKHGFAEGDELLRAFAVILSAAFGKEHCCRISADHFAVQTEMAGLDEKLEQLFRACQEMNGGKTLPLHVGVYTARGEQIHVSTACDRAKLACDALSGRYESAVKHYSRELNDDAVNRRYIVESFDRAMAERWIQVYQQPIIRAVNERVCDVEALARWIDPEKGLLSPAEFIPALEDAGLIWKLDLYMLDRVLESIHAQQAEGLYIVPHSINLSRSDFDACDAVEEIRRRVDAAGIDRDRITIEITENVIGRDFEFMKTQVERFRALGFRVWMDDFGSGYSSMNVLQSIRFDLIKFDMSFLRKLDEGTGGRIILTELIKMVTSLGIDTVCEGVETEEQVRFLQEIGCSKLQGYYYSKPMPFAAVREMSRNNTLIRAENPAESDYYETIGRISLYDLGMISGDERTALQNVFNTLPIAIMEIRGDKAAYVRSNPSYRAFFRRFFHLDILHDDIDFENDGIGNGKSFAAVVRQCCQHGNRTFFDEKMPDGSLVHAFARRVGVDPVTGTAAVAIAVLSVTEPSESTTYADIARVLAADYYSIFLVDLDTDDYVQYASPAGGEELSIERHGTDFFTEAQRDTITQVHEDDRAALQALFTKEKVLRDLASQGVFSATFRMIDTGEPVYVNMKVTRMHGGNRIILGISNVDAQMKQQEEQKKLRQDKLALGRIAALSPNYIAYYSVDPVTGRYLQYNPSSEYANAGLSKQGEDFFGDVARDSLKVIDPEDLERHQRTFTEENVMRALREKGSFIFNYRILLDGKSVPVSLRAALVQEANGEKIILGVSNDEEEYKRQLEEAYRQASSIAVIYTHIAHALARGNTDLYYVNLESGDFIEYHTDDERGVLNEARRGTGFFEECAREVNDYVHADDREAFVRALNGPFLTEALDKDPVFELTYRKLRDGQPFYVQMKITRMEDDPRFIVLAVSDIDELMRQRRAEERMQEERVVYARLHALTGNFIVVYVVDPETDHYREFSATEDYVESLAQAKEGTDFFERVREAGKRFNYPVDLDRFLSAFTKENVMTEVRRSGIFTLSYRFVMEGKPLHVQMKAAMVEEKDGPRLIVGLNDVDAQVRQEEELGKRLAQAQSQANIDALTGVKNKHAYLTVEANMDRQIAERRESPFAVVLLDVNDLKKVNDTLGHQAGDQYIRDACRVICDVFEHSPVFRVGGDEFAVISQGKDYDRIDRLVGMIREHNEEAMRSGGVVIACGMSKYDGDDCVANVFERADQEMYTDKNRLKSVKR